MKPILKVFTDPFRNSKAKKSKKQSSQQNNQNNNNENNQPDNLQNNVNMQKGVAKDNLKFLDVYGKVQKIVDQLGNMLNFKEKMTDSQKRQLINELSSMAIKQKKFGSNIFDEDVLEFNDDENHSQQQYQTEQHHNERKQQSSKPQQEAMTSFNPQEKLSKPSSLTEKQLKDLAQWIINQNNELENDKTVNKSKQTNLSTFADIKSQMCKFWIKNSSKVLKLVKSNKNGKSIKSQSIVSRQHEEGELRLKKKKPSFVSSLFSSWNGKKQQKTLNSTGLTSSVNSSNVIEDEANNPQQSNQLYDQNEKQQTKIQFND